MSRAKLIVIAVLVTALIGGGIYWFGTDRKSDALSQKQAVTVYKSPTCGCCVQYISLLEKEGYDVQVETTDDMAAIHDKHGIKPSMESCHTALVGDYVVEGHMPFAAMEKLLSEKPAIRGIALPGMPAGSPGMPGVKEEPFRIYALSLEDEKEPEIFIEL